MVWRACIAQGSTLMSFYKDTEQVKGRESFEVGVSGLGRPLWGGPDWAQCWMRVGASRAVTWVRFVLDRGSERPRERWERGEQIQGGAFQSSRSPTARHGWFCGHLQGGWLEPHVSEQTRFPSISLVFCHIYGISLAFCHIAGKKKGMYLKGWGEGGI